MIDGYHRTNENSKLGPLVRRVYRRESAVQGQSAARRQRLDVLIGPRQGPWTGDPGQNNPQDFSCDVALDLMRYTYCATAVNRAPLTDSPFHGG